MNHLGRSSRIAGTCVGAAVVLSLGLSPGCQPPGDGPRPSSVTGVAFSPDGRIVAAQADGNLRFITSDGQTASTIQAHVGAARGVAFNSTFTKVGSVGDDGKTVIFDPDGRVLLEKTASGMALKAIAFQPGMQPAEESLAVGGDDGAVRLFRGDDGQQVGLTLMGHVGAVNALAFGPAGTPVAGVIVTTGEDGTLRIFPADASSDMPVFTWNAHDRAGNSITFSPDGALCPTVSDDGTAKLWPSSGAGTQDWMPLFVLTGHTGAVLAAAFSPDGALLATGGADRTARLWNPSTGELVRTLQGQHTAAVTSVAFNPDASSRILATGSADGTVVRWNIDTGAVIR